MARTVAWCRANALEIEGFCGRFGRVEPGWARVADIRPEYSEHLRSSRGTAVSRAGRKPMARELRVLRGAEESTVDTGPKLPPTCPPEPRWADLLPGKANVTLRTDGGRLWASIVPELDAHGILARVDELLVVDAVICAARIRQCERLLAREGLSTVTERGVVKHPVTAVMAAYRTQFRSYVAELGLSPSSRSRLPWNVAEDQDDLERILSGPKGQPTQLLPIEKPFTAPTTRRSP